MSVPASETRHLVGQLAARGYPRPWIGKTILIQGFGPWLDQQTDVPADLHARVGWLVDTAGQQDADELDDGISNHTIDRTVLRAMKDGHRPPPTLTERDTRLLAQRQARADARAWHPGFDRNGDFSARFLPDHPWAHDDDVCGALRDALGMTLERRYYTRDEIMAATGCYQEQLTRMRKRLGLGYVERDEEWVLTEEVPGALARAHAIYEVLDEADDVTLAFLKVGMAVPMGDPSKHVPHIAVAHPAVAAWEAWKIAQARSEHDRLIAEHLARTPADHSLAA